MLFNYVCIMITVFHASNAHDLCTSQRGILCQSELSSKEAGIMAVKASVLDNGAVTCNF